MANSVKFLGVGFTSGGGPPSRFVLLDVLVAVWVWARCSAAVADRRSCASCSPKCSLHARVPLAAPHLHRVQPQAVSVCLQSAIWHCFLGQRFSSPAPLPARRIPPTCISPAPSFSPNSTFMKQRALAMYPGSAYGAAMMTQEVPIMLVCSVIFAGKRRCCTALAAFWVPAGWRGSGGESGAWRRNNTPLLPPPPPRPHSPSPPPPQPVSFFLSSLALPPQ